MESFSYFLINMPPLQILKSIQCHFLDNNIMIRINKIKNRILFLSPTVQAGWQNQSHRTDFEFLRELGSGSFAVVHKVKHKRTGTIYALKQIKKKTLDSKKVEEHCETEVKIMYKLNHPHIIKLYNHFQDEMSIYLVLEFAEGGQLYTKMRSCPGQKFEEKEAASYIYQVALGLQYMHKLDIMHRDIKPENILVDANGTLKIADFGWSHFINEQKRTTFCGTLDYLAPEMLEKGHYHDYHVDIWSIGVLIYELCAGQSPFSGELLRKKICTEQLVKNNIRFVVYSFPPFLSKQCKELIEKILVRSPQKRPSISQILNDPWIKQANSKQIKNQEWQEHIFSKMKQLFPELINSQQDKGCFSKEEIYKFSRIESVINTKPKVNIIKKIQMNSESMLQSQNSSLLKRIAYLEQKVFFLQTQHNQDKKEIQNLKEKNRENEDRIVDLMRKILGNNSRDEEYQRTFFQNAPIEK